MTSVLFLCFLRIETKMSVDFDYDIIIVGAGLAGLTAAHQILKRTDGKLKVLILEAKDRIGGRTLTIPMKTAQGIDQWDIGGQWVGNTQYHLINLLDEIGMKTYDQYTEGTKWAQVGSKSGWKYRSSLPTRGLFGTLDFILGFLQLEKVVRRCPPANPFELGSYALWLDSMSMEEFSRQNAWTDQFRQSIDVGCLTAWGVRSSQVSALYFAMYGRSAGTLTNIFESTGDGAQARRIKGGSQEISRHLEQNILDWKNGSQILLNDPVLKIAQTSNVSVDFSTLSGKFFRAKFGIVAIPPSEAASIRFDPILPEAKRQLFRSFPMGNLLKFIATYSKAFWRDQGFSGEIVANGWTDDEENYFPILATFDATSNHGNPAIVGFVNPEFWDRSQQDRKRAVLEDLARYLGPDALHAIDYQDKNWSEEPYSGGCPTGILPPGRMEHYLSIRQPDGRIHWAGTETATEWMGYMSGAVQSGLRAANEVLYQLVPNVVSEDDLRDSVYARDYVAPTKPPRKISSCWGCYAKFGIFGGILAGLLGYWSYRRGVELPFKISLIRSN